MGKVVRTSSELTNLINQINAKNNANIVADKVVADAVSKERKEEEDTAKNFNTFVDNISTASGLNQARLFEDAMHNEYADNPLAILKLQEGGEKLDRKGLDYHNWSQTIDSAYERVQKIQSMTNEDFERMTMDEIMTEQRFIKNFKSQMYEDPLKQDKEVPFFGDYTTYKKETNADGEKVNVGLGMKDTEIYNFLVGEEDISWESKLNTAILALEDNRIIDLHELPFVISGQTERFTNKKTYIRETVGEEIKLLQNQRNYLDNRRTSMAQSAVMMGLKDEPNTAVSVLLENMSDAEIDVMYGNDAMIAAGNDLDIPERDEWDIQKQAEWKDATIEDFFNYLKGQQDNIDAMLNERARLYYKWIGRDPVVYGAKDREALRALEKAKREIRLK